MSSHYKPGGSTAAGLFALAALVPSIAAHAQTAGDLSDLIGARTSVAESALQERGYQFAKAADPSDLWWNAGRKTCVSIYVDDNGRVASINSATAKACGHGGGGNGAAVVLGALVVGAIVAGAASSDRDKPNYGGGYGGHRSYSPAANVVCYPRQAACYKYGEFSAKWTRREF